MIPSLPETYAFVQVAQAYATVGDTLLELSIDIHSSTLQDHAARVVYMSTMRKALRAAPNLTDLALLLPKTTPQAIFFQVSFPVLQSFKTNLLHRTVQPFLAQHTTLMTLVVGPCGTTGPCPLANVQLDHLTTLKCHAPCLHALAHGGLVFLKVENHSATCFMSKIVRTLPSPMPSLYSLSIDIFPDDTNVLSGILRAAPRVKKLRLLERQGNMVRHHPYFRCHSDRDRLQERRTYRRRVFNDYITWYRDLRKLVLLEELAVQTAFPLSSRPGHADSERRVINGWVSGLRYRRSLTAAPSRAHPSLYCIML